MTRTRYPVEPPRTFLPLSRRGWRCVHISAIVYIMACLWLGPTAAFWLTVIGAWTVFWLYLCSRFPFLSVFTVACITGFIGGLFGWRGGYYYRPYYRRRR